MTREVQPSHAPLLHTGGRVDDAQRVADAAVLTWRGIDAALSPIIGHQGFAALYRRCIYLRRAADPGLAAAHEGVVGPDHFAALHVALSQRSAAQAELAQRELLQSLHDLLVTLIGEPLTTRLLRPVPDATPSATDPQDTTS